VVVNQPLLTLNATRIDDGCGRNKMASFMPNEVNNINSQVANKLVAELATCLD